MTHFANAFKFAKCKWVHRENKKTEPTNNLCVTPPCKDCNLNNHDK